MGVRHVRSAGSHRLLRQTKLTIFDQMPGTLFLTTKEDTKSTKAKFLSETFVSFVRFVVSILRLSWTR
jgi:hypothetical protein